MGRQPRTLFPGQRRFALRLAGILEVKRLRAERAGGPGNGGGATAAKSRKAIAQVGKQWQAQRFGNDNGAKGAERQAA